MGCKPRGGENKQYLKSPRQDKSLRQKRVANCAGGLGAPFLLCYAFFATPLVKIAPGMSAHHLFLRADDTNTSNASARPARATSRLRAVSAPPPQLIRPGDRLTHERKLVAVLLSPATATASSRRGGRQRGKRLLQTRGMGRRSCCCCCPLPGGTPSCRSC